MMDPTFLLKITPDFKEFVMCIIISKCFAHTYCFLEFNWFITSTKHEQPQQAEIYQQKSSAKALKGL